MKKSKAISGRWFIAAFTIMLLIAGVTFFLRPDKLDLIIRCSFLVLLVFIVVFFICNKISLFWAWILLCVIFIPQCFRGPFEIMGTFYIGLFANAEEKQFLSISWWDTSALMLTLIFTVVVYLSFGFTKCPEKNCGKKKSDGIDNDSECGKPLHAHLGESLGFLGIPILAAICLGFIGWAIYLIAHEHYNETLTILGLFVAIPLIYVFIDWWVLTSIPDKTHIFNIKFRKALYFADGPVFLCFAIIYLYVKYQYGSLHYVGEHDRMILYVMVNGASAAVLLLGNTILAVLFRDDNH